MRRRKLLKQIGTTSTATVAASGLATADDSPAPYLRATIDGERQTLTREEFDAHPETPPLADVQQQEACSVYCCECCDKLNCTDGICECEDYCGECRL